MKFSGKGRRLQGPATMVALALMLAAAVGWSTRANAAACASALPNWNVPNGAIVLSRGGDGPIRVVMDSIGEYFTHSALSHGSSATISHSSMQRPGRSSWPTVCSQPVDVGMLNAGWPGPSRVNAGATWGYYFNDGDNVDISWQSGNAPFADSAFYPADSFPSRWQSWPANSNRGAIMAGYMMNALMGSSRSHTGNNVAVDWYSANVYSPFQVGYQFSQYVDMKDADLGFANCTGSSRCSASVCSTFLASNSRNANIGWVDHRTYPNNIVNQAAQSLYNQVFNQCKSGLGYWGGTFASAACLTFDSLCSGAANQIVNSFVSGRTGDTGSGWRNVLADPNKTARSISPDCLGGWANGKGVSGCPATGGGSSAWGFDLTHPAQFNGPGALFGCWN
jgi:hypothetical protein